MLINIVGEQPFQILNDSFTISPAQSGYDLYFSADGKDYSYFLSVGAGINRQITGMNEGNFYKLMGLQGEVSVNWMKSCSGSGSGGGGEYVLPKATSTTLGGIKVGDNLSIDSDGVLSASEPKFIIDYLRDFETNRVWLNNEDYIRNMLKILARDHQPYDYEIYFYERNNADWLQLCIYQGTVKDYDMQNHIITINAYTTDFDLVISCHTQDDSTPIEFQMIEHQGGEGGSINNAGDETTPVYTNGGKAIACSTSTDGKRWGTVPRVRDTDGVMEVGKYLDFHTTPDGTTDYDGRLSVSSKDNALYFKNENGEKKVLLAGDNAGDYNIVDDLPTNNNGRARLMALADEPAPTQLKEGQMAWLTAEYGEKEATTLSFIQPTDNYYDFITFRRKSDNAEIITLGGQNFDYPEWGIGGFEDGFWHTQEEICGDEIFTIHYLKRDGNFIYYWDSDEVYADWIDGVKDVIITSYEGTISYKTREGAQYLYSNEFGWKRNIYNLDTMTPEEKVNFALEVQTLQDKNEAFIYPVTFSYEGQSYRAINVFYEPMDNTIRAWSLSNEGKHIAAIVDAWAGSMFFEEKQGEGGGDCNYRIVNDLGEIEDIKDGLRVYVREQNFGGTWYGIRVNPKGTDGDILWVDGWETICFNPEANMFYFKASGDFIWDNDIHYIDLGSIHGAYKIDEETNRFILVADDWGGVFYEVRGEASGKDYQLEVGEHRKGESYIWSDSEGWKTFPEIPEIPETTVLFDGQSDDNVNAYNKFVELQFDREGMAKYVDTIMLAWGVEYLKPLNTTFHNDIVDFKVILNGTIQTLQLQMDGTLNLNY